MFFRPCCTSAQLPRALHEAPKRQLTFHTHGDVDFEHFYRAIAGEVADPCVMFLSIPSLSVPVVNLLLQCFERDWITDLVLSTNRNDIKMISCTLKGYMDHISYATDNLDYYSSQLVLYTSPALEVERRQMLSLVGPLFSQTKEKGAVCTYDLSFVSQLPESVSTENGDPLSNAVLPFAMVHRSKEHIVHPSKSDTIKKLLYSVKFPNVI